MKLTTIIVFLVIAVNMSVNGSVIFSANNMQKGARVSRWQPAVDVDNARATGQRRTSTTKNFYASLRDPTSFAGPENDQRKEIISNAIDSRGSERIPFQEYEHPITVGRNSLSLRYWEMKLPATETVSTCTFVVLTDESGKTLWVAGEGQAGFRMRSEIQYRTIDNILQLRVAVIDAPSAQRDGYIEWDMWEYSPQSGKVSFLRTMRERFPSVEARPPRNNSPQQTESIKIGLVDNSRNQYQDGCGCGFWPVSGKPQFKCILIGNYNKQAWMNIDGKIVQFRLVRDTIKYKGRKGDRYFQTYQSGNITVNVECVATGFGDTHAVDCNATITVIRGVQKQVVKALGSCGC